MAIVAKIRADVPTFANEPTCYISDQPPTVECEDNLFCTVAPGDGEFDQGQIDGSGNLGVVEGAKAVVTIWSRIQLDQTERFELGLTDAERGLMPLKQQVLTSLAGKNLNGGTFRGDSCLLLTESMLPMNSRWTPQKTDDFASVSIAFLTKFNWNLGTNSELV